jgi:cation diffusion facilitator CzcD-associated flavoprotein CzcO
MTAPPPRAEAALAALAARVREDLERIAHPRMPWLEPRIGPDGQPALDALVVGGGQSGLAVAFGLMRAQVRNILVVDRTGRGQEGPWLSYARMPTLRSPKDYTGPDLDLPSLTYQSWHEARFGRDHWKALALIPRESWAEYLLWMRDTVDVPVRNGVAVEAIGPAEGGLLAVTLRDAEGLSIRHARKVVLATGQEGGGHWWMPDFIAALPPTFRAHAADPIDFAALRGRRVAVLGAGASAFDNAAMALEAGAARVDLFCRRAEPQVVQPYRWLTFAGFLRHLSDLDDAWRWRFMARVLGMREGFPQHTFDRCAAHPNFTLRSGAPWTGARLARDAVEIDTPQGPHRADFLICGTGIEMDFARRPELAGIAENIACWADRYTPPEVERDDRLARFPYLAPDFAFTPRDPARTPWMRDLHLFAIASTMSFGPSGSSINAMTTAVPKLVSGITRGLFEGDLARHWAALQAYDEPQAVVPPEFTGTG